MRQESEKMEQKQRNKVRILKFIVSRGSTSRPEIASALHLSVPTTMQHVKELLAAGLVTEEGELESNGGRKARALAIVRDAAFACGVDITKHHICMALVNARRELIGHERIRCDFSTDLSYFEALEDRLRDFLSRVCPERERLAGVGFSLPGFVDKKRNVLTRSDVLQCYNVSFQELEERLGVPVSVENDANSAAYAEFRDRNEEAVYLSLSGTVGGAIYYGESLYEGNHAKSAEFGHMIIKKGGRRCYCGKKGCVDAYCNTDLLQKAGGSLEGFFAGLRVQDPVIMEIWEDYLDNLALTVGNLRVIFDCDIYLGGYLGGYLEEFLPQLAERTGGYDRMEPDRSYIRIGRHKLEAAAYGAALPFTERFLERA
ncbi:MAG: ROK family transcriptional regulator [Eubacteriales bacterium]|nr:ROK family transcriptional regulator [Eubacteriales bacterium]